MPLEAPSSDLMRKGASTPETSDTETRPRSQRRSRSVASPRTISWKKLRVMYDENAHRDFVTGFSRRKAERRVVAEQRRVEKEKAARKEARKEKMQIVREMNERRQDWHNQEDKETIDCEKIVRDFGEVDVLVEPIETVAEREFLKHVKKCSKERKHKAERKVIQEESEICANRRDEVMKTREILQQRKRASKMRAKNPRRKKFRAKKWKKS